MGAEQGRPSAAGERERLHPLHPQEALRRATRLHGESVPDGAAAWSSRPATRVMFYEHTRRMLATKADRRVII